MQSFKTFLSETLNKPYPYKWTKLSLAYSTAEFVAENGDTIELRILHDGFSNLWEVVFRAFEQGKGGSIKLTGKGDAFRIMATIMVMLKEFMTKFKNATLFDFSADKEGRSGGRAKLYRRLLKNLRLPAEWKKFEEEEHGTTYFKLINIKKHPDWEEYVHHMKEIK